MFQGHFKITVISIKQYGTFHVHALYVIIYIYSYLNVIYVIHTIIVMLDYVTVTYKSGT